MSDEIEMWGPDPRALAELHDAPWRGGRAPDFGDLVGACKGHPNPDLWFSDLPGERLEAQELCLTCPAAAACFAQSSGTSGIWGGKPRDGKSIRPDVCSKGHDDWVVTAAQRTCRTCQTAARRARRAARAAA